MIKAEDALGLVFDHSDSLEKYRLSLSKGISYYVAEAIFSPIDMPPFRQSAMDGYALNLSDGNTYKVIGEIKAGDSYNPKLEKGEAVRIFTGAAVPKSANSVVVQEKVAVKNKTITLDVASRPGDNIRPIGEQVKANTLALKKGTRLTPAAIGYLASLGITDVEVYKKPRIAILVTGDELVEAGQDIAYGEIYESNSLMLSSALKSTDFTDVAIFKIKDDYKSTYTILNKVIADYDAILITGGISVGDYDFVGKALRELAVQQVFYKIKQKPGKPFFFGKKEGTSIFALPGNPAAALSCFYVYVYPALLKMSGNPEAFSPKVMAKSASVYSKKGNGSQFLKAIHTADKVTFLEGQSSSMLQTFALANALVYIPEEQSHIAIGDVVQVIPIP
ncbi:MAG: molybdopterin molybdenumtransferase MoeA [Maribacter sp.]|nr:MAG: molybdopterin molybdenumtransferase MoeA [Maribacter sp.]